MRHWCATNHGGSSCLQKQLAAGWQWPVFLSKAQCTVSHPGELWKGRSHCQPVIPFLASFDLHFLFSCSSQHPLLLLPLTPALPAHSVQCSSSTLGSGCISFSACPSYRKAFGIWGLKDEGGSVLSPAPHLDCIYNMSWRLLAAPGLLQMPWLSSSRGTRSGMVGHLVFPLGCATTSCFFFFL